MLPERFGRRRLIGAATCKATRLSSRAAARCKPWQASGRRPFAPPCARRLSRPHALGSPRRCIVAAPRARISLPGHLAEAGPSGEDRGGTAFRLDRRLALQRPLCGRCAVPPFPTTTTTATSTTTTSIATNTTQQRQRQQQALRGIKWHAPRLEILSATKSDTPSTSSAQFCGAAGSHVVRWPWLQPFRGGSRTFSRVRPRPLVHARSARPCLVAGAASCAAGLRVVAKPRGPWMLGGDPTVA